MRDKGILLPRHEQPVAGWMTFDPISIDGEPLSQTIIEQHR